MKGFVTCDRHNCVNCRKGLNGEMVCQALYDNDEYKEYCPFFKSKDEAEKQRKKLLGVKVKEEVKHYTPKKYKKPAPLLAVRDDRYPNYKKGNI